MNGKRRLAITASISALGTLLILSGLHAGANDALAPVELPAPIQLLAKHDDRVALNTVPPGAAQVAIQRAQTVTLDVTPNDMMSDTWPVRQDDIFYNWPAEKNIYVPSDAESSLSYGASAGTITHELYAPDPVWIAIHSPNDQAWITITYRTRTRAVRSGDLVTLTAQAAITSSLGQFDPLTSTVVFTRQFPPGAPSDHWGYTYDQLVSAEPIATGQGDGWVQWITSTDTFVGKVTVREPLFGSDLTITQFLMDPPPALGEASYFTVTVSNIGAMTAARWFATELYVRPASDPPPQSPYDHYWGLITFRGDALLRKPGTVGDWKVENLGPGENITLFTVITVTSASNPGDYKAYAQVDTAYEGENYHYAWFGSNPEGYGVPPYSEENNIATLGRTFHISATYRVKASSPVTTLMAAPGRQASYWLYIQNAGNITDTFDIMAVLPYTWTVHVPDSLTLPPGGSADRTVLVDVPSSAAIGDYDWAALLVRSQGDPTQSSSIKIKTIAASIVNLPVTLKNYGKRYIYLPLIIRIRPPT